MAKNTKKSQGQNAARVVLSLRATLQGSGKLSKEARDRLVTPKQSGHKRCFGVNVTIGGAEETLYRLRDDGSYEEVVGVVGGAFQRMYSGQLKPARTTGNLTQTFGALFALVGPGHPVELTEHPASGLETSSSKGETSLDDLIAGIE